VEFLRNFFLLIIVLFCCSTTLAQQDTLPKDTIYPMAFGDCPPDNPYFYSMCGYKFGKSARTLGIMPEYQAGNSAVLLGFSHGYFEAGEWGGMGKGITLNGGFLTRINAYTASAGVWSYRYFIAVGPLIGAKAVGYWNNKGQNTFAIRPEVGLFFFWVQLKYGYDIRLNKDFIGLNTRHNFTFSFYLPVYPRW
jgi:hypothetical protein